MKLRSLVTILPHLKDRVLVLVPKLSEGTGHLTLAMRYHFSWKRLAQSGTQKTSGQFPCLNLPKQDF